MVPLLSGNRLFHLVAEVLGLHATLAHRLLTEVLATVGSSPQAATVDELGVLLPEIERRVMLLMPYDRAAPALGRLRRTLLTWEG
jgi:hypothetical protein